MNLSGSLPVKRVSVYRFIRLCMTIKETYNEHRQFEQPEARDMDKIKKLQRMIEESCRIVFFGGAGVSTESGIPDFRSMNGLYSQQYKYPPETILSHTFFVRHTEEFFRFYKNKLLYLNALPNAAHKKLAQLERTGKLLAVVTQNIDGLHQAAGSKTVYELHGSVHRNYCAACHKQFGASHVINSEGIPLCDKCGGLIKPDVVLYGEPLCDDTVAGAVNAIARADCLIIAGTSLSVYPAAGMIRYFGGKHLVLINRDETPADSIAQLVIHGKVGETLSNIIL